MWFCVVVSETLLFCQSSARSPEKWSIKIVYTVDHNLVGGVVNDDIDIGIDMITGGLRRRADGSNLRILDMLGGRALDRIIEVAQTKSK